jgi:hypothetical protein
MSQSRHFVAPTYVVGFALTLVPPIDSLMQLLPINIGLPHWRFGAFGVVSNSLLLSVTGLLVVFLATTIFGHAQFRRILGFATAGAVLVLGTAWIVFLLDTLQVRNDVKPAAVFAFKVASIVAALKSLLAMVTLATLAAASFRGPRPASSSKASRRAVMLIGGTKLPIPSISGGEVPAPAEPTA